MPPSIECPPLSDDESQRYDSVELSQLGWLKTLWPSYVAFHEAQAYHLPANFNDSVTGSAVTPNDARWKQLNRIAYLSYSIFVNIALAKRLSESSSAFSGMLDLYDRTSGFFLRIGAAIDQAQPLEHECSMKWDRKTLARSGLGNASEHKKLTDALVIPNKYNNFLKHNGLPAVRFELVDGVEVVRIPDGLDYKIHRLWVDQTPSADSQKLLSSVMTDVLRVFDAFYKPLASDTPVRLEKWKLVRKPTVHGIQKLLQTPMSGALAGLDGYQGAAPEWQRLVPEITLPKK